VAGWSEEDFDDFVTVRLVSLVRFAYRLTGDLGHAQDIVQVALTSVYVRSRHRRPDSPEAYVRKAIVNAFASQRRRRRVREQLVDAVPDAGGPCAETPLERRSAFFALLDGLSPRQRAVLVLRYYEDWSEDQIAASLGAPVGTVKSLASRGLAILRARAADAERSEP
jgi:RNA polymerase sigma-70 factor (sigma-E family)